MMDERETGDALTRVLVVDDEPDIRLVVRLGLEAAGLAVAVAGSAAEAMEVAASFGPQLILLDVEMPGVDGPSALVALRHHAAGRAAGVAFLTARADPAAVQALRQLDVIEVLTKPVDPLRLGGLLRELWRRRGRNGAPRAGPTAAAS
jgi:two-component system, OmpR family, response regulator